MFARQFINSHEATSANVAWAACGLTPAVQFNHESSGATDCPSPRGRHLRFVHTTGRVRTLSATQMQERGDARMQLSMRSSRPLAPPRGEGRGEGNSGFNE